MAHSEFFVTKGAGASDLNGGGPRLGALDAPIYTTANASVIAESLTTVVDNAGTWVGVLVDDWICIDTGGLKEHRRVSALAPDGDTTKITIASAATACANKTCNVGGAWATVDYALSMVSTTKVNAAGDWPRVNLKYSATAYNEYVECDNAGTAATPLTLEGYETTAGDGCPNNLLPNIDGTGKTGYSVIYSTKYRWRFRHLYLTTNVDGDNGIHITGYYCSFYRIKTNVTGTGGRGFSLTGMGYTLIDCMSLSSIGSGFYLGGETVLIGCIVRGAGVYGFQSYLTCAQIFVNCVADGCVDDGFYITSQFHGIINCTSYGSIGGSGFRFVDPVVNYSGPMIGCIAYGNNQYGIECAADGFRGRFDYNALGANSVAARLNSTAGAHDVALSGDPFTNAAGHIFTLNNNAGAGAACRSIGFPGVLLDGLNTGYTDIGALQHLDAGAAMTQHRTVFEGKTFYEVP